MRHAPVKEYPLLLTEGLAPGTASLTEAADGRLRLGGRWTADQAPAVEAAAARIAAGGPARLVVDLGEIERLDTLGAWVLERTRAEVEASGGTLAYLGTRPEHRTLLGEVVIRGEPPAPAPRLRFPLSLLDGTGRQVVRGARNSAPASPSSARSWRPAPASPCARAPSGAPPWSTKSSRWR